MVSAASVASVTTSVKWPRGHRSPVLSHRSLVFILISPISTFCSVSQLDIQLTQTGLTASPSLVPGFTSLPSISAQGATTYLGRPGLLASFLSHTSLASDCTHSVFTRVLSPSIVCSLLLALPPLWSKPHPFLRDLAKLVQNNTPSNL